MKTKMLSLAALCLLFFSTCKEDENNNPTGGYFVRVTMDGVSHEFDNFQLAEYNAITKQVTISVATTEFITDIQIGGIEEFGDIAEGNFKVGTAVCNTGIEVFNLTQLSGYSSSTDISGGNKFLHVIEVKSIDANNVEITGTVDNVQSVGIGVAGQDTMLLTAIAFKAKVTNKFPDVNTLDFIEAEVDNEQKTFYTAGISRYDYPGSSNADELYLTANIDEQEGNTEKRGFTLVIDDIGSPPVTGTWTHFDYAYVMYSTYTLDDCSRKDYTSLESGGSCSITISSVTPSGGGYIVEGTFFGVLRRDLGFTCCETLNAENGSFRVKI